MASYNDDFIVKNGLIVRANNLSNYQSTSTTTGAIVTPGGVGIGGDVNIGGRLNVDTSATLAELSVEGITKILSTATNTATITPDGNALQVFGGIYAENINLSGIGLIKGSRILTVAEGFQGGIIAEPLIINTTTNSTSTTTGALVTPGGIGVGSDVHIGGSVWTTGTSYVTGSIFGGEKHVLNTVQFNGNSYVSAKVVQNGYTATVTLTNTGVTSLVAGTGISVSTSTGTVTVGNTGVLSIISGGGELQVDQATGNVTLTVASTLQDVVLRGNQTDQTIAINNPTDVLTTSGNALDVLGSIGAYRINVVTTSYVAGAQIVTTGTINQYIGGTITQPLRIANTTSSINTQTGALVVDGGVGIGENLNVGKNFTLGGDAVIYGGLTVVGSYTTVLVNSTQTVISDPAIDLGAGFNGAPLEINDGLDRGLVLHFNTGTSVLHEGHAFLGRQATSGELVFLTNLTTGTSHSVPNPYSGDWGNVRFGQLRLTSSENASSTTTGALVTVGGIGVGGDVYATRVFDGGARVVSVVNITTGSGLAITSSVNTGPNVSYAITNTGVLSVTTGNGILITGDAQNPVVQNIGVVNLQVSTDPTENDLSVSSNGIRTFFVGNTSTLQTVTARGNETTSEIIILNQTTSTEVTSTNALQVLGGISAKTLLITDKAYLNGAEVVTSATINAFSGGTINNSLKINSGETSTSTSSGALVVNGGLGVTDNMNIWNTIKQWNTNTTGIVAYGTSEFHNTLFANTLSALSTNLNIVSQGTGSVYINGVNLLAYDANVWYVSEAGSDSSDGRRIASAFKTIKHALSVAQPSDVVFIEAGTYEEVWPLTVPQGVTVKGAGVRATIVKPTVGTNTQNGFQLNGETTVSDLCVEGFFKPGYAFTFATGAKITTKSPYVERVSVITRGSSTSSTDPYGFAAADAGNGAKLDAGVLDPTSLEPAMLWNEVTFIVPNATGWYMTNGARAEILNGFSYFADKAIHAVAGTTGYGGVGKTRLKLENINGVFKSGETITYEDPNNNILAQGTISSTASGYIFITGPSYGFETITDRAGKTVTTYGDAVQSTIQKKFGTTAGKFDGNGDYLEVLSDTDLVLNGQDYTIEAWVYLSGLGKTQRIARKGVSTPAAYELAITSSNVVAAYHGGTTIVGTTALTTGQWYHVALSRQNSSNTIKLYLNGTLEASSTSASGGVSNTDPLSIGGWASVAADSLNGYMDDFRVSNNYRYPSNFTAPTTELISDANTVLLLNMNGGNGVTGFIDTAEGSQDIYSSGGATATRIALADYHQFGAELRCIGSAAVFGNSGVVADGTGTNLKIIAFNMSHIGSGGDLSDDDSLHNQANEVIMVNNGKVYYQTVDHLGDFRVGEQFIVNQRTGNVSFGNAQVNLSGLNQLTITDGTNNATILPQSISVGNLSLAGNTISSLSGNLTLDPAGTLTTVNSDLAVNGSFSVQTLAVPGVDQSTSTLTGAMTVAGGAGIGGNLNVGGTFTTYVTASSTSTIANNAIQAVNGGVGAKTIYIEEDGWIGTNRIVTTATIGASLGGIVPNAIHITNTDANFGNTTSGALIVDGGAAVAGNLTVGGDLTLLGGGSVLTNVAVTTDAYIGASVVKAGTTATINIVNLGVQSLTAGSGIAVSASTGTVTIDSTDTLGDVTSRGATTADAISLTSTALNSSTIANNALSVSGGIGADSLYIARFGWLAGSEIVTTATLGQAFNSSTQVTGQFNITNTSSNAFYVAGGGTVGGNFTIGGNLTVNGTVTSVDSNSVNIGNKVVYLSTLTGSAALSAGSGIIVGKDDNNPTTDWATWIYDGGEPGFWTTTNGIKPMRDDLEFGTVNGYWWKTGAIKDLYFDQAVSTSTSFNTATVAGNALRLPNGGIGAKTLHLTDEGWIAGAKIVTSANFNQFATDFDGGTISQALVINNNTPATNTTTGALEVLGGAGIGQALYVGKSVYINETLDVTGSALIQSVTTSTAINNGALVVNGGVGIGQNLRVNTSVDIGEALRVTGDVYANSGKIYLPSGTQFADDGIGNATVSGSSLTLTANTSSVVINSVTGTKVNGGFSATGVVQVLDATVASSTTTGALQVVGGISTQDGIYSAKDITTNESIIAGGAYKSTSSIAGNVITAPNGGIGAQTLYLSESGYINGAQIITSATLNSFTGGAINNSLFVNNDTQSTSTVTGALVVTGGVGIGKNLFVGGNTYLQGDLFIDGASFMLSSNTIQTGDKLIYVSTGATSSLLATNSGIGVGPVGSAYATWLFDNASTSWKSTVNITGDASHSLGIALNPWGTAYVNTVYVRSNITATNTTTGSLQVLGGISASENLFLASTRSNTLTNTANALTALGGAWIGGELNVAGTTGWINNSPIITANSPFDVILTSTTDASATNTGALQVVGGVGIGKNLVVGEKIVVPNLLGSTSTANDNALVVSGGGYFDSLMVNTVATVAGGIVITTATIGDYAFNGGTINKPIVINSATQSISTTTGALQIVNGGAGVGGNVYVGQTLYVAGTSTFFQTSTFKTIVAGTATFTTATVTSAIANTSTAAGNAFQVTGGGSFGFLRVANQAWVNGSPVITAANINQFSGGTITNDLTIDSPTQSLSTITGAFRVINGGVGIGGNVFAGGSLNTIDPTGSVDGFFGPNDLLTALEIGTNTLNKPVDIIVNNVPVARFTDSQNFAIGGNHNPIYGVDVYTPSAPTWAANTVSNLLSLRSSQWADLYSSNVSRFAIGAISTDFGSTFEHWITSGEQTAGNAEPLVFAGGAWADSNDGATNTVTEWARFTATGNFTAKNYIITTNAAINTATISGNALQVTGGIGASSLLINGKAWVRSGATSYEVIHAGNVNQFGFNGGTITQPLYVNTNTQAVNATSGAIRTAGGISAVGNIYAGANFYGNLIATNITATNINARGNEITIGGPAIFSTATTATQTGGVIGGAGVQVTGGLAVNQNAIVGGSSFSLTSIEGNAVQVPNGGLGTAYLYVANEGYINGAQIVTSATINSFSGGEIANALYLSNTTDATSTSTGALRVAGGVGIGKNLWVGADVNILGNLYVDGTSYTLSSTNIETGNKVIYLSTSSPNAAGAVNAGIAVGNTVAPWASFFFNGINSWSSQGNIIPSTAGGFGLGDSTTPWNTVHSQNGRFYATTDASSTQTGALQVVGGVGIGKKLVVGSSATVLSSEFNLTTSTFNALTVVGGIGGRYLTIDVAGYINGSQIITAANIGGYAYNGGIVNTPIVQNSTLDATSLSTGSIVTAGGAAINKQLQVGYTATIASSAFSTSTIANNALAVTGGIGARSLYLTTEGWINGSPIITAANINSFSGGTINSTLAINNATQAINTTTGALQVINGGVGIGGNVWAGGTGNFGVTTNAAGTLGTTASGSLTVLGGASVSGLMNVGGAAWFGGNVGVQTATPGVALEVNGNFVVGAYNSSRVQIVNAGGTNAIYEVSTTESNPRWTIGRDLLGIGVAGLGFMNANQALGTGGAAVGAVSASTGFLGLYTTNGTSQTLRAVIDSGASGGNMGLGITSSLQGKLHVQGAAATGYGIYARGAQDHVFLSNNAANYSNIQISRTTSGVGSAADIRIGAAGGASNFLPTAVQGDAVITFGQKVLFGQQSAFEVARIDGTGIAIATATSAISVSSGALRVTGGAGIGENLYVGGLFSATGTAFVGSAIASTSTKAGNALVVTGGIGAASLWLDNNGWINGYQIVTTQNIGALTGAFNGGTITNPLYINNTTDSGSTSSGALYTTGGIGITKQLYVGGTTTLAGATNASGIVTVINATAAVSTTTGGLKVTNGGLGVGGAGYFGTFINLDSNTTTPTLIGSGNIGRSGGDLTVQAGATTFSASRAYAQFINGGGVTLYGGGVGTTGNITLDGGASEVVVSKITNATNTATGALQVRGGVAVGNGLVVGGQATVIGATSLQGTTIAGVTQITNITSATSTLTGALQVFGGVGVQGDIYARNIYANGVLVGTGGGGGGGGSSTLTEYISVTSSTVALSTTTGAVRVTGGVGIGKNLFVAGPITVGGSTSFIDTSAQIQANGGIQASGSVVGKDMYASGGNLLVQSSDFTQANWAKFNSTVQAGSTISPDGTLNGTKLIETAATGGHYFQQTISQTGPITFSAFLKAGERTFAILNATVAGQPHAAWFNLTTGAPATKQESLYKVDSRCELLPYGASSGWYRCSITVWAPTSATTTAVGIYTALGSESVITGTLSSYTGTAGNGLYVYGAQAEPGYYPGDYFATAASTVAPTANSYVGGSLYVANTGTVGGSPIVTSANLMTYWGGTSANTLQMTNTTNATSTQTGALQVVGGVGIGKDVWIGGTLYATAKSFLIDHPSKPGYKLQYGSLEGPENGVYVRGRLTGKDTIELPYYWKDLVDESTITVDLTPIGKHQKLYVEEIVDNTVVVGNDNLLGKAIDCFYVVWAERKDVNKLTVERKE